jgi:small subunit ribosomal protein S8
MKPATDTISDLIIRLKNANNAGKSAVTIPASSLKHAICNVLKAEGFVGAVKKHDTSRTLEVELLYTGKHPRIHEVFRISKPSKRVYSKSSNQRPYKNGYGRVILSTPQGIMTGEAAKKANVGGELLFKIW